MAHIRAGLHPSIPLPPACSSKVKIFVNSETTEKIYTSGEHLCPMDGFVCFLNSHLIRCGWRGCIEVKAGGNALPDLMQGCGRLEPCLRISTCLQAELPPNISLPCAHYPPCRSGRLGKVTLGGGNKSGLFQVGAGGLSSLGLMSWLLPHGSNCCRTPLLHMVGRELPALNTAAFLLRVLPSGAQH